MNLGGNFFLKYIYFFNNKILYMLNKIYIHYITTLFVLESFIISCWLLKGKKKSESSSLLEKNRYRNRPWKIMIGASLVLYFIKEYA